MGNVKESNVLTMDAARIIATMLSHREVMDRVPGAVLSAYHFTLDVKGAERNKRCLIA